MKTIGKYLLILAAAFAVIGGTATAAGAALEGFNGQSCSAALTQAEAPLVRTAAKEHIYLFGNAPADAKGGVYIDLFRISSLDSDDTRADATETAAELEEEAADALTRSARKPRSVLQKSRRTPASEPPISDRAISTHNNPFHTKPRPRHNARGRGFSQKAFLTRLRHRELRMERIRMVPEPIQLVR